LDAQGTPVIPPSPLVPRRPVTRDGFPLTFWQYVEEDRDRVPDYAANSHRTAALHAVEYVELKDADQGLLPFSWSGVTLHASGAARLRVRITKAGEDTVSIAAVDTAGRPVLSVESLALRPSGAARLLKPGTDRSTLLGLDWVPAEPTGPAAGG
ncbi:hypothetical protein ADL27_31645, partial [Streptomyces sp. NRRL F-6602]